LQQPPDGLIKYNPALPGCAKLLTDIFYCPGTALGPIRESLRLGTTEIAKTLGIGRFLCRINHRCCDGAEPVVAGGLDSALF
jgi:hypothetical protein